jgi:hypothetical protein
MQQPTFLSFNLHMYEVANICRKFFDQTIALSASQEDSEDSDKGDVAAQQEVYNAVLRADAEMKALMKHLPDFLKTSSNLASSPPYIAHLRRQFTISVAHKTLVIHRRFFLSSLTNPWYNFQDRPV